MFIVEIADRNRVCRIYHKKDGMDADNVKTFEVDAFPKIEENSTLYFNPNTKQFKQMPINNHGAKATAAIDAANAIPENLNNGK